MKTPTNWQTSAVETMAGPAAVQHRRRRCRSGLLVAGLCVTAPAMALALCSQTSPPSSRRTTTTRPTASAAGSLSMNGANQPEHEPASPSTAAASSLLAAALLLLRRDDSHAAHSCRDRHRPPLRAVSDPPRRAEPRTPHGVPRRHG